MKKNYEWLINPSNSKPFVPTSVLNDKIKFSHPQSSLLILGDYQQEAQDVQAVFNRLIINQFKYCIYVFDDHNTNDFAKSLLRAGCRLYKVKYKGLLDGSIDSDVLNEIFQNYQRLVISVKEISFRFRIKYWELLRLQIRNFQYKEKVPLIPYLMVWFDKNLTSLDPMMFEHFRILGLWGDSYGLRFTISLDRYESLSSPARSLFGVIVLFQGICNEEVIEILDSLSLKSMARNRWYKLYQGLGAQQGLVVSPAGMFDPFMSIFG